MQIRNFVFHHPLVRYLKITKKNLFFMQWLSQWSTHKSSWALLSFSAFGLLITALVMQHVYDLQPCVLCIYQRTAVLGIGIAALLPVFYNHGMVRLIGYIGWIVEPFGDLCWRKNMWKLLQIVIRFLAFVRSYLISLYQCMNGCPAFAATGVR